MRVCLASYPGGMGLGTRLECALPAETTNAVIIDPFTFCILANLSGHGDPAGKHSVTGMRLFISRALKSIPYPLLLTRH